MRIAWNCAFPWRCGPPRGSTIRLSVERGPLVYSLKIGESWHKIKQTGPSADWEVYPTTPWNYALVKGAFQVTEKAMERQPSLPPTAPGGDHGEGAATAAMDAGGRFAGRVAGESGDHQAAEETITLVPYGAAKLRITAFPWLE